MGTPISSISITSVLFSICLVSLFLLSTSNKGSALDEGDDSSLQSHFHIVHISSLLPAPVCSPSTKDHSKGASLKVVHRHGPCSRLGQENYTALTPAQILSDDQHRVNSIQSRLNFGRNASLRISQADLPAKPGSSLGTGNYIVTVGLGTPKKDLSLIFDTGSDLTWTQCLPCVGSCYRQQDPIFDPSKSNTYRNITCNSTQCSQLTSATGNSPGCSSTTCIYGIQYGDQSFSVGYFGTETLTLTPADVFPRFQFGCGQNNRGLFGAAAGLLGLGRNQISIVSQTASEYGKYFSYCLPSTSSSTGHLTFGKGKALSGLEFTPFSKDSRNPSFYFIDIVGIKVGGRKLSISKPVFEAPGAIIDSGTVISRLPPAAYAALRTAFRRKMKKYPMTGALSILDTCYDFSKYSTVTIPTITFVFGGNVEVPIFPPGTLYVANASHACLAFAGNSDASDLGIFGNIQQRTLEVAYDVAGGKLGFGAGGCS